MTSEFMLKKLDELRRNARMSRDEFEAMKLTKFRNLVRYAGARSPYYTRLIEEHSIDFERCTPADFPPLTKSELMDNFDDIVTDYRICKKDIAEFLAGSRDPNDLFLNEFVVIHTSGSSGEIGYFVYSMADWGRGMSQFARRKESEHYTPSRQRLLEFRHAFYGAIGGHFAGVTMMGATLRNPAKSNVKIALMDVNSPLHETVSRLNEFKPDSLSGYTGAMMILAAKQREGALRIAPSVISTTGEGMSMGDRKLLQDTFGCQVSNGYNSSEHLFMGFVGDGETSMKLYDDDLIYEILDDHVLITNLFNFTLPLIRYRMSDILRPVKQKADPTSPYLEVDTLVGRNEVIPMFTNENGAEEFIHPIAIAELFAKGVTRFQMQLMDRSSFAFLICLDPLLDAERRATAVAEVTARLREVLAQKKMSNVTFQVRVVDDIPVNPVSRKFQLIVPANIR